MSRAKNPRTTRFSLWLVAKLRERGLTMAELARQIGVSHTTVLEWTNRGGLPHPRQLPKLAEALESTEQEIMVLCGMLTPEVDGANPKVRAIVRLLEKLPPEDLDTASRVIRAILKR